MEWPLEELLPHRAPMVFIDEVVSFSAEERKLVAKVEIGPKHILFVDGGVPNWAAIEFMAQASAALAGHWDKSIAPDQPSRPGLLLGTRRLELGLTKFEAGRTYLVTSVNSFSDADAASFECSIADEDGQVVATATLNAYRPPDLGAFLRKQAAT